MIKLKAFIYRFSAIFGLRIYLAEKEEQEYIDSLVILYNESYNEESTHRGMWQADNGFTTVWTYKVPFCEAMKAKIKHAFNIN